MDIPDKAYYNVDVFCENCESEENVDIEKGQRVSEFDCPNCGCADLVLI